MSRPTSRVLLNTGDGKGKSSAAFGVMVRAWARGWTVGVVQFIKSEKWVVGERKLARHLDINWHTLGDGFTWESTDIDHSAQMARHAFEVAAEMLKSGNYDLIILDEFTYPLTYGWIEKDAAIQAIKGRSPKTNVVITGRNAPLELLELADTATEMRKLKHAYDQGIRARKGIEY
ncbi:MAG: cob(I)yrinic acid a,c-diamide adenosyltransferase [Actinobacteria bacterium]|nr:cob(I)yrinic acid a,c-diamide adenosyltransferase [Actinomycetota bacterium]MCL6095971.1 cob(I)yrinic acid a,c-diamide adenosyltransferase [Actinomycetota bacterium]